MQPRTPEEERHWREALALLDGLLALPEAKRPQALREIADPRTRDLLQRWLANHERASGVLDDAVSRQFGIGIGAGLGGRRFGRWRLDAEIGRGGMAVVYRATAIEAPAGQQAAVKILSLGALAQQGGVMRFVQEQQLLSRMRHPGIASLFDAGVSEDGTPWFAMALIDGERIDHWCERHSLDPRAIVELLLQVCDAAAYAHRNLVIHRDIKPSNVLVDEGGHPRLLDFGIARLVEGLEPEHTATALRALTPEYAAPEQFDGRAPSTAMDVFGLGALLYRLLTGHPPRHAAAGNADTGTLSPSRVVRHDEARDPLQRKQLARRLRGDLDTIVMKALAHAPDQRYPSVDAFAEDLQRWRDTRPIRARAPSLRYRAGRFVARNRWATAMSLALMLALATGIAGTWWQSARARQEAEAARRAESVAAHQAKRAEAVSGFLGEIFTSTEPREGDIPDAMDLLDAGSKQARESLAEDSPAAAAAVLTITGDARFNLSDYKGADADYAAALGYLRGIDPAPAREFSELHNSLRRLRNAEGEIPQSLEHARLALAWLEKWPAPPETRISMTNSFAMALLKSGDAKAAERVLREQIVNLQANPELAQTALHMDALNALSYFLAVEKRDIAQRIAVHEQRLALAEKVYADDPGWLAYTLADAVPTLRRSRAHLARAELVARRAVAISDRVHDKPHMFAAVANCNLAALFQQQGDMAAALTYYDRSIAIDRAIGRLDVHAQSCLAGRAYVAAALGEYAQALADLAAEQALGDKLGNPMQKANANRCLLRAAIRVRQRQGDEAAAVLQGCTDDTGWDEATRASRQQAMAEQDWARGDYRGAEALLTTMRPDAHPDAVPSNAWLRPWMLSWLVARQANDKPMQQELQRQSAGFAAANPALAECMDATTRIEQACLRLP